MNSNNNKSKNNNKRTGSTHVRDAPVRHQYTQEKHDNTKALVKQSAQFLSAIFPGFSLFSDNFCLLWQAGAGVASLVYPNTPISFDTSSTVTVETDTPFNSKMLTIAQNYSTYRPHSVCVEYVPNVGTDVNGSFVLCFVPANTPPPLTPEEAMNLDFRVRFPLSRRARLEVPGHKLRTTRKEFRVGCPFPVMGQESLFNEPGKFYCFLEAPDAADLTDGQSIGTFSSCIDAELIGPIDPNQRTGTDGSDLVITDEYFYSFNNRTEGGAPLFPVTFEDDALPDLTQSIGVNTTYGGGIASGLININIPDAIASLDTTAVRPFTITPQPFATYRVDWEFLLIQSGSLNATEVVFYRYGDGQTAIVIPSSGRQVSVGNTTPVVMQYSGFFYYQVPDTTVGIDSSGLAVTPYSFFPVWYSSAGFSISDVSVSIRTLNNHEPTAFPDLASRSTPIGTSVAFAKVLKAAEDSGDTDLIKAVEQTKGLYQSVGATHAGIPGRSRNSGPPESRPPSEHAESHAAQAQPNQSVLQSFPTYRK